MATVPAPDGAAAPAAAANGTPATGPGPRPHRRVRGAAATRSSAGTSATGATAGTSAGTSPTRAAGATSAGTSPTRVAAGTSAGTSPTGAASGRGVDGSGLVVWQDPQGRFSVSAPADGAGQPASRCSAWAPAWWCSATRPDEPSSTCRSTARLGRSRPSCTRRRSRSRSSSRCRATPPKECCPKARLATRPRDGSSPSPSATRQARDHQARGFQVTVVKGSIPYIISGSAPTELFQQNSSTFDQMVETFQFS